MLVAGVSAEEIKSSCLFLEGRRHLDIFLPENTLPKLRPGLWRVAEHEAVGSSGVPDTRSFLSTVDTDEHRAGFRRENACELAGNFGLRLLVEDMEESTTVDAGDMATDVVERPDDVEVLWPLALWRRILRKRYSDFAELRLRHVARNEVDFGC